MKYLLLLTPLLFLFTTTIAKATDYYFCDCQAGSSSQCAAGNDSNNGTSPSSARQTFSSANSTFNKSFAGDSINFCRGGAFTTDRKHKWVNNRCTASNMCTVSAYNLEGQNNPSLASPIITQTSNSHLFSLDDSGAANHEEGYKFSNLDLRCTGCSVNNGWAFFFYNDIDHVIINDVSFSGFDIGVHLAANTPPNSDSNGMQDFITLQNLKFIKNIRQGILGGANNLTIKDSIFENNGTGTIFDHNIYISRGNDMTIKGNDLYKSSLNSNGNCNGVSLVVHGTINNLLIENNVIHEDIGKATHGCWGIAVDSGYAKAESFRNITIRGNKVINVGNISIGIAACDTCTIENNVIFQNQSFPFTAISAPDRPRGDDDLPLTKITIRNNSIYTNSAGTGIKLGTEGSQHIVVNNAMHYTGTGKFTCINVGLASSAYSTIDNNICYFPNALASSEWEAGSGNSLGAWQGQSGFGINSKNVNPEFKNPNFQLLDLSPANNSSPLSNSGHTTLSTLKDHRGKTRDAQPDIGAYEFGSFNPPAKTNLYLKQ